MATLLCHIEINPGKEEEFEAVMKEMYRRTHAEEPNCVSYEYFRDARGRCKHGSVRASVTGRLPV
jgi:quinol monooxygenase YgiN